MEAHKSWGLAMVQVELLGVDGINGDTMDGVGPEWWEEGSKRGLQLALEPEVLFNNFTYLQVFLAVQTFV